MDSWLTVLGAGATAAAALGLVVRRFRPGRTLVAKDTLLVLGIAGREAKRRDHRSVTPVHLALALLADPGIARALEPRGVSLQDLYVDLERLLPPPSNLPADAALALDLEALGLVRASGGWRSLAPGPQHLLHALLRSGPEAVRSVFEQHGLTAERWPPLASPASVAAADIPDAGPYRSQATLDADVVFWNDTKTTMEFVMDLLRDTFGVAEPDAIRLMLSTHQAGFAVVGTYERAEAERLAEVAMRLARERGFPLRVSVAKTGTTRAPGLITRWLQRVRNTSIPLDLGRAPATASTDPSWADLNEPLACPECHAEATRYRKVADALVCPACARSFAP